MMKSIRISINRTALMVMLCLTCAIAYQASGRRAMMASPTVVVTVNRAVVLEGLNEKAEAQVNLKKMSDKLEAESNAFKSVLQDLRTQLGNASTDGDRNRLTRALEDKTLKYQGFIQFANERLDVERYLLFESLYRSIASAIEHMAQAEGYDIVLVDDASVEFIVNSKLKISREDQIKQQIASRRIMYSNPSVDITEALIIRMNNAFDAG